MLMKKKENYKTIGSFCETNLKEKSSVFNAHAYPIENEEDAIQILEKTKKKYYDATHHCYAYKLTGEKIKYSDAGEPSGTAGIRILNAINHFNLQNVLVIVIRYFGGTKLGAGPLGKAYYNSAVHTLEVSRIIEKKAYKRIVIEADLNQMNNIYHSADEFNAKIIKSDYSNNVMFECLVSSENAEQFVSNIIELSKGEAKIVIDESIFFI
jgi:uncharacterized YigZ family protein